ncbi:DUF3168 domain-containing protein [Devosia sp. Leaf64]|uniref:DUF3168 domain-containing protein n=1 Tax=Devosia sp. Leaf64 TaxID=1736229 RepID=UPI000715A4BD|nr:DUF3168 domain-containing protein [Devosia sp. Leaf64]KQN72401.1 hypothetical protein ASE94_07765 [Devosia sp. Leaf64]
MAPDIALQIAIHNRLISAPALTALVLANHIKDSGTRPDNFPCIRLGDAQIVREGETRTTRSVRVYMDLHCWTHEGDMMDARAIADEVRNALSGELDVAGHDLWGNFWVTGSRTLRDPKEYGHVIVSVEAMMTEVRHAHG